MKKFCVLALALVLGLGSMSYGVVIGDFETGLDGWAEDRDATISQSDIGVTTGSQSMKVEGLGGWHINTVLDAKAFKDVLSVPGAKLSADITVIPDDITSGWMQVHMHINGQNNDDSGPHNNIGWRESVQGLLDITVDGTPHTYTWDLPEDLSSDISGIDDNIWWFEVVLISNLDGGSPMTMYVDNIQAIPEPATMLLLSLGSIALIKRRK